MRAPLYGFLSSLANKPDAKSLTSANCRCNRTLGHESSSRLDSVDETLSCFLPVLERLLHQVPHISPMIAGSLSATH